MRTARSASGHLGGDRLWRRCSATSFPPLLGLFCAASAVPSSLFWVMGVRHRSGLRRRRGIPLVSFCCSARRSSSSLMRDPWPSFFVWRSGAQAESHRRRKRSRDRAKAICSAGASVAIWTVTRSFQVQLFMNIAAEAQLSSADAGDDGSRSVPRRLLGFVFGYDFFVSYSWSDQVFLDRADYALGDDWKKAGAWTLLAHQPIDIGGIAGSHSPEESRTLSIPTTRRNRLEQFGAESC